ncbi:DUF116 domain-containing protein [Thermoanaerobacter pentosaceus]|uniref:DUF116 domain-containing protein n=1 Tax=Thermoanaerobacter pentosaceus TaxID=694059 RepID=A0ABT9M1N1_9THEO|nr:DUF116 domain-containing protein [Thermoanaerobacter pentosaceus]MDP9750028.1 hypothetical protein [Thermoanaerobacter pentosaceus]
MKGKKRIFLGILAVTFLVFTLVVLGILYVINRGKIELYRYLFITLMIFVLSLMAIIVAVIGATFYVVVGKKSNKILNSFIANFLDLFYPLVVFVARVLDLKIEKVEQSYIEIKNFLFNKNIKRYAPQDILILSPHCIQNSNCKFKVTYDIDNCRRCGKCQINDLVNFKDKYGVNVAVATGGTMARKVVKDTRPKVIIAIACERDLTSGMRDVKKIPVYGIINDRPNGPCFNTRVDVSKIEKAIKKLLNGG